MWSRLQNDFFRVFLKEWDTKKSDTKPGTCTSNKCLKPPLKPPDTKSRYKTGYTCISIFLFFSFHPGTISIFSRYTRYTGYTFWRVLYPVLYLLFVPWGFKGDFRIFFGYTPENVPRFVPDSLRESFSRYKTGYKVPQATCIRFCICFFVPKSLRNTLSLSLPVGIPTRRGRLALLHRDPGLNNVVVLLGLATPLL